VAYKRSWREISWIMREFLQRKKKEPKKKEKFGRGGLWKLPQLWKSDRWLRSYFLDDFHKLLG